MADSKSSRRQFETVRYGSRPGERHQKSEAPRSQMNGGLPDILDEFFRWRRAETAAAARPDPAWVVDSGFIMFRRWAGGNQPSQGSMALNGN